MPAPIQVVNIKQELPAFNPRATIQSLQASAAKEFSRNAVARKADHKLHRDHLKRLSHLRSCKAVAAAATKAHKSIPDPMLPSYSDAAGLLRARELLPKDAPLKVFDAASLEARCRWYGHSPIAHGLVKENAYTHSTFVSVIDLRDDEARAPNGTTIRRGAVYDDGAVAAGATKLALHVFVEMDSNLARATREIKRAVGLCPSLTTLDVEIIGSNVHKDPADFIAAALRESQALWAGEAPAFALALSASRYEEEE